MKRHITWMLAAVLATSGVSLAACGGTDGKAAGGSGATAEQEAAPVDPSQKFLGEWKLACAETQGITVAGDIGQLFDDKDETSAGMGITINKDGTGSMSFADESGNVTWTLADDNTLSLKVVSDDGAEGEDETFDLVYDTDRSALVVELTEDDFSGKLFFTADGTMEGVLQVDLAKATNIASLDSVVGDWSIAGMGMAGMVMYGEAADLSTAMGDSFDPSISIAADGTVTMDGDDTGTLVVGDDGATIEDDYSSMSAKMLDDYLVLDMSDLMGIEFFMLYTK